VEVGGSQFKARLGKSMRPYLKYKLKAKQTGDMAQVVENFLSPVPKKKNLNFNLKYN
jgi:hypothetical protein